MTTGSGDLDFEVPTYPVCKIKYLFWKMAPEQNCGAVSQLAFELPRILLGNQQRSLPKSQALDFSPTPHLIFIPSSFQVKEQVQKVRFVHPLMNTGGGT